MKKIDYAIIGGSYAGLSAALQLARARRTVLVVDAGQRRNRSVDEAGETAHGFLTQDGRAPAAIALEAKQQLLAYPSVQWLDGTACGARVAPDGRLQFHVGSNAISAGRLIIATGVRGCDCLPRKLRWVWSLPRPSDPVHPSLVVSFEDKPRRTQRS